MYSRRDASITIARSGYDASVSRADPQMDVAVCAVIRPSRRRVRFSEEAINSCLDYALIAYATALLDHLARNCAFEIKGALEAPSSTL
jgi:hypothetical protein